MSPAKTLSKASAKTAVRPSARPEVSRTDSEVAEMKEVASGVFLKTDSRGTNLGVILTQQGPVLVDTPLIPREARAWKDAIVEMTGKEPLYIINTDHHKGHALGNPFFGAPVIAHEAAWKHMRGYGENFRQRLSDRFRDKDPETARELLELQIRLPDLTLEDRLTLYLGDKTIRIIHVGGHTPASSLVYVSEARVVFTGDVVVCNMHPFMAQSDTREWLDALSSIRRMKVDCLIPGHGPVCDKAATEPLSEYLRIARARVRKQFNAGKTKAESSAAVLSEIMSFFPRMPASGVKLEAKVKSGLGHIYDEYKHTGAAAEDAEE